MNSILLWLISALLELGSVAQQATDAGSTAPAPTTSATAGEGSRSIGNRFAQREMLPPCGMVDVTPRSPGTKSTRLSPPRQAWRCLDDAVGVGGAELVTLDQRRNGSSRHTFYRATRDGRLEIWTQRTRPAPGRGASRWTYTECTPSADLARQPCAS